MPDEVEIPKSLQKLQLIMGQAVAEPFIWDEEGCSHIQTENYPDDIVSRIQNQKKVDATERLMLYNRGYWWRLFSLMQDEMQLLVHLNGYGEFNRFSSAYLEAFPPETQVVNYLYDHLPEFMDLTHEWNTPLIKQVVELEYCYIKAFDAAQLEPLDPQKLTPQQVETLSEQVFTLQPHVFLFKENWNLTELRKTANETDDDDLILEPVKEKSRWLIYRSLGNKLNNVKIDQYQWKLLKRIKEGLTFNSAIETAFAKLSDSEVEEVAPKIQQWFSDWVSYGIFSLEK